MSQAEQNLRCFLEEHTTYNPDKFIRNRTHYNNGRGYIRPNSEEIMLAVYRDLTTRFELYKKQIRHHLANHPEKRSLLVIDLDEMTYNDLITLRKKLKIRGDKVEKIEPAPASTVDQAKEALAQKTRSATVVDVVKSNHQHDPYGINEMGQYYIDFAEVLDDEPEHEEFLEPEEYAQMTGDSESRTHMSGNYINLGYEPGAEPLTAEEMNDDIKIVMEILAMGLPEYAGEQVTMEYLTTISRGQLADVYLAARAYSQKKKGSKRGGNRR